MKSSHPEGLREHHRLVRLRVPLRRLRRLLLCLLLHVHRQRTHQRPLHDGRGKLLHVFRYVMLLWLRLLLLLLQWLWRRQLLWRRMLLLLLLLLHLRNLLLQCRHLLLLLLHLRNLLDVQFHDLIHGRLLLL